VAWTGKSETTLLVIKIQIVNIRTARQCISPLISTSCIFEIFFIPAGRGLASATHLLLGQMHHAWLRAAMAKQCALIDQLHAHRLQVCWKPGTNCQEPEMVPTGVCRQGSQRCDQAFASSWFLLFSTSGRQNLSFARSSHSYVMAAHERISGPCHGKAEERNGTGGGPSLK
jgi:hypothetical protein